MAIIFEKFLRINKAPVALVMAVICWLFYFNSTSPLLHNESIAEQIYDIAQIIFFLLSVMVIVELIDSHHGFTWITDLIHTPSKIKMLWSILIFSFFLSAILDNLTTMVVMISLLKKMIPHQKDRWLLGSMVVIAVNAGGVWTPIGDVTTTLLWVHQRLTPLPTVLWLFFPSLIHVVIAGLLGGFFLQRSQCSQTQRASIPMEPAGLWVFILGVLSLILIPVWTIILKIPPFMGAFMGLGMMWLVTDRIHIDHGEKRGHLRVAHALTKIDFSGLFFLLGILLAVAALQAAGLLNQFALYFQETLNNRYQIASILGIISSILDNVPLVAATIGMYDVQQFPVDDPLWQLLAYVAGTGGSILIIGSAAGVVFMGIERVDFFWYFKRISWIAFISYWAGIGGYALQRYVVL